MPSAASANARQAAGAKGVRHSGQNATWCPDLYRARHRLLKVRERLPENERRRPCELFAHDLVIGEAWGLKETFRAIYRAPDRSEAEVRLERILAAVGRAALPAFDSFAVVISTRSSSVAPTACPASRASVTASS
jgi:hypothetical protein